MVEKKLYLGRENGPNKISILVNPFNKKDIHLNTCSWRYNNKQIAEILLYHERNRI